MPAEPDPRVIAPVSALVSASESAGRAPAGTIPPAQGRGERGHRERLLPSAAGWLAVLVFAAVVLVAVSPVSPTAAALAAAGCVLVVGGAAWLTSPVVAVADGHLVAGRARIPVRLLGRVTTLDRAGVGRAMGPGLDARAYVCLRTWAGSAVVVEVLDPEDPTPYWIVSTRRPERLASVLRSGQAPSGRAR